MLVNLCRPRKLGLISLVLSFFATTSSSHASYKCPDTNGLYTADYSKISLKVWVVPHAVTQNRINFDMTLRNFMSASWQSRFSPRLDCPFQESLERHDPIHSSRRYSCATDKGEVFLYRKGLNLPDRAGRSVKVGGIKYASVTTVSCVRRLVFTDTLYRAYNPRSHDELPYLIYIRSLNPIPSMVRTDDPRL